MARITSTSAQTRPEYSLRIVMATSIRTQQALSIGWLRQMDVNLRIVLPKAPMSAISRLSLLAVPGSVAISTPQHLAGRVWWVSSLGSDQGKRHFLDKYSRQQES